jgi:hypothetical protein
MWTLAKDRDRKPRFPYPVVRATLLALLSTGALYISIDLTPPEPPSEPAPPSTPRSLPVPPRAPAPSQPSIPPPVETAPVVGCPDGCATVKPGCEIKGNISSRTGERIYHLPSQMFYGRTVISPESGEKWFCTEEEAEANGWRRAKV